MKTMLEETGITHLNRWSSLSWNNNLHLHHHHHHFPTPFYTFFLPPFLCFPFHCARMGQPNESFFVPSWSLPYFFFRFFHCYQFTSWQKMTWCFLTLQLTWLKLSPSLSWVMGPGRKKKKIIIFFCFVSSIYSVSCLTLKYILYHFYLTFLCFLFNFLNGFVFIFYFLLLFSYFCHLIQLHNIYCI